ncbi:MAG: nitrite reductase small subunit NirD [Streptosporangiales bacterium]|nr:nitrite reductase small subunit NirD [Streptosporangiales bacterium]
MTVTTERRRVDQRRGDWARVWPLARLQPERGVAALLRDGTQVAVFRTYDGDLYAVANVDPACGAAVLSRGIVGDRAGVPTIASPMHKHVYALPTGECLTDPRFAVARYDVRVRDGAVEVRQGGSP